MEHWKMFAKAAIFLAALLLCRRGSRRSQEPENYFLWALMFILVLLG